MKRPPKVTLCLLLPCGHKARRSSRETSRRDSDAARTFKTAGSLQLGPHGRGGDGDDASEATRCAIASLHAATL